MSNSFSGNELSSGALRDLRRAATAMAHNPIRNYVTPGLTSRLIGADGHGKLRLFTSDRDTRHWITPHSHRFDFVCLVLRGTVRNILFERGGGNAYCVGTLRAKNGGLGGYDVARDSEPTYYSEHPAEYAAGETYSMTASQIHSIQFSRDAEVLFFEFPETKEVSLILEPWSDGACVPTFESAPWMFQREVPA